MASRKKSSATSTSPNNRLSEYGGFLDPIMVNQAAKVANSFTFNETTLRNRFPLKTSSDRRRNINDECGYPTTGELSLNDYRDFYERHPIAARVVEIYPKECWKTLPRIFETEDHGEVTRFEAAWNDVGKQIRGRSWCKGDKANRVWEYLRRADILSGIGSFGAILLGFDDGLDLDKPVAGLDDRGRPTATIGNGTAAPSARPSSTTDDTDRAVPFQENLTDRRKLVYMRVFDQSFVKIGREDNEKTSPRYKQPVTYKITFGSNVDIDNYPFGAQDGSHISYNGPEGQEVEVHWTRIIHVADIHHAGTSSELYAQPRQQAVFNRLYDLRKLYGGSAEMYWQGAFPGLSFETHPSLGGDVSIDKSGFRDMIENYYNGLQRYLWTSGFSTRSLAPQVVDPSPQIERELEAIAIRMDVPKRILMGSERGELSSGQDLKGWNERLIERRENYLTPRLICPLVDRLILVGALPIPEHTPVVETGDPKPGFIEDKGYGVEWADISSLTMEEQGKVAVQFTNAMAKYAQSGVDSFFPPRDFFTRILGMTDAKADVIIKNALRQRGEKDNVVALKPPNPIEGILKVVQAVSMGALELDAAVRILEVTTGTDTETAKAMLGNPPKLVAPVDTGGQPGATNPGQPGQNDGNPAQTGGKPFSPDINFSP